MKRILVTGANGFLGRHVVPLLLASGYEVHTVSRSTTSPAHGVRWHQANLLDEAGIERLLAMTKCEYLLHLAWCTTPPTYWESPENLEWERASARLFESFACAGGRRIVATGSCAEYSWEQGRCREDSTPLEPVSLYGRSKLESARALEKLAATGAVSAVWARIFFPYGPGEHPSKLVSSLATALLKGEPAVCASPELRRDFIYVADVATALSRALESDISGMINVGSGTAYRIGDIAERIASAVGRKDLLRYGQSPAKADAPLVLADVQKLASLAGWEPRYTIQDGLEATVHWLKERLESRARLVPLRYES